MAKSKNLMNKFAEKTSEIKPASFVTEALVKSEIIVLPELRDLIPALAVDESKQLEENIVKYGIKDPLSVWETDVITVLNGLNADSSSHELFTEFNNEATVYILFDGHNRYGIAKDKGVDFKINKMSFASLSDVKDYMIDYQLGRRNLTPEQASYLRGLKYNELKKAGKNKSVREKTNVAADLASEFGVTDRTIKRDGEFAEGIDKLTPEFKNDVLSGKTKLAKKDVQALKSAKIDAPINSMESVLELLKEEDQQKDPVAEEKVDNIVDSIFNQYDGGSNNQVESSNEPVETPIVLESTLNLEDFKVESESEVSGDFENDAVKSVVFDDEVRDDENTLSNEEIEINLKSLFNQELSKDVLIQIINTAGELLSRRD